MSNRKTHVCPLSRAGMLDSRIRRWAQDPMKILAPYVREGMTVLDFGCGPGFFSIDMARMVGPSGRVIAADLQEEMLQKIRGKIQGTELEGRITLHKCDENRIGLSEVVDFVLLFYAAHEVPDHEALFAEIAANLKPDGQVLIVEPPFHVSDADLEEIVSHARKAGLTDTAGPRVLAGKTVVLKKGNAQ
jgi:ubiquinone/menaquinone biosynthesis C-methylase UbiE